MKKKLLNILLALGVLGLVVACKPAGNAGAKLKRHVQPSQPVDPWEGTPEEILAQEGSFWYGNNPNRSDKYSNYRYFMGFKSHNGKMYVYLPCDITNSFGNLEVPQPKNAEKFWPQPQVNFNPDTDLGKGYWFEVEWLNAAKTEFTIPKLGDIQPSFYKLDIPNKTLLHVEASCKYGLEKWNVNALTTEKTEEVKILTEEGKTWPATKVGRYHSSYFTFYYDDASQKLYVCESETKADIKADLQKREIEFEGNDETRQYAWQLLYQDPQNPKVFRGTNRNRQFRVIIVDDSHIQQVIYYHRDGENYCYHDGNVAYVGTYTKESID